MGTGDERNISNTIGLVDFDPDEFSMSEVFSIYDVVGV
jgi:hypothetical protein